MHIDANASIQIALNTMPTYVASHLAELLGADRSEASQHPTYTSMKSVVDLVTARCYAPHGINCEKVFCQKHEAVDLGQSADEVVSSKKIDRSRLQTNPSSGQTEASVSKQRVSRPDIVELARRFQVMRDNEACPIAMIPKAPIAPLQSVP